MTYLTLKTTKDKESFILTETNYAYINPIPFKKEYKKRALSKVGSESYKRSLRRAFARAKLIAFFNPDLTQFITLTYHKNQSNYKQTLKDIENLINYQKQLPLIQTKTYNNSSQVESQSSKKLTQQEKLLPKQQKEFPSVANLKSQTVKELSTKKQNLTELETLSTKKAPFKYIYVLELQKRGAIHVHMIANDSFQYEKINGHKSMKGWSHGFSECLTIKDFDDTFKPYLYLFKYMTKAQRVGSSFIHTSRKTFDKIELVDYREYINYLEREQVAFKEDYNFTIDEKNYAITKNYFRKTAR